MNDNEIKKVIKDEADRVSSVVGIAAVAVIIVSVCAVIVGVCWAGAWLLVRLAS